MRTNDAAYLMHAIAILGLSDPGAVRKANALCRDVCEPYPGPGAEPAEVSVTVLGPELTREHQAGRAVFMSVTTPTGRYKFRLDVTAI